MRDGLLGEEKEEEEDTENAKLEGWWSEGSLIQARWKRDRALWLYHATSSLCLDFIITHPVSIFRHFCLLAPSFSMSAATFSSFSHSHSTTQPSKKENNRKTFRHFCSLSLSLSLPVCFFIAWAIYSLMATGSASANKRALIGLISLLFCFVCLRSPYTRYAHSRQWLLLQ